MTALHAIDIHTHVVPHDIPAYGGSAASPHWPAMVAGADRCHRTMVIGGAPFRTLDARSWDTARRRETMAAGGIARQLLSPMPELLSYWMDVDQAVELGHHVNDAIAAMVAQDPAHFAGLCTVPLQDPDRAACVLERLMATGLFRGVEVGTNIDGVSIGDPRFHDFFATAEALGAAIFVHPVHPAGRDRLVGPPAVLQLVAFPGETALAVASLITGGLLHRCPRLRIAIAHGGGGFALTLPRLIHGWQHLDLPSARSPLEQARSLFYDTLVYDAATLRYLIAMFGAGQLCLGTDHPFTIEDLSGVARIAALGLDPADEAAMLSGNARRFLGEPVDA